MDEQCTCGHVHDDHYNIGGPCSIDGCGCAEFEENEDGDDEWN